MTAAYSRSICSSSVPRPPSASAHGGSRTLQVTTSTWRAPLRLGEVGRPPTIAAPTLEPWGRRRAGDDADHAADHHAAHAPRAGRAPRRPDRHRRRHRRPARRRSPRWRSGPSGWPPPCRRLGVQPGDRVATLAWNHQAHFEAYLAVPAMGAVLHTLNLRLFPEQLAWIINHAEDKVLLVDESLTPLLAKLGDLPSRSSASSSIDDGSTRTCWPPRSPGFAWPELDENSAATMCYTSGTTGNPKGVVYSHRSVVPPRPGPVRRRRLRHQPAGPDPARRPDVPRQRLGPPLRRVDGRRRLRAPRPDLRRRPHRRADPGRAGHLRRGRPHDLERHARTTPRPTASTSRRCG